MEKYRVGGHAPLARWIVNEGARRGLALSYLREMQFDDGISVPTHYLNPDARFRLVPVTMNCTAPPIPPPERAHPGGGGPAVVRAASLRRAGGAGPGGTAELLAWVLVLAFPRGPADVLAYMPA